MSTNAQQGLEQFQKHMGQEEGVSDWHQVKQDQINLFADATGDHQFIHVDPERAAKLSPYKVTIAHGFLTLSLIPFLGGKIPPVEPKAYEGVFMGVNYGLDKVRFPSPVKVDSRVRARRELVDAELKGDSVIQLKQKVTIEVEGEDKPACVAETLTRLMYQ
jgi:acyl dehydratase